MYKVIVPASTANFGCGTDCAGAALSLYLTATFQLADRTEIVYPNGGAPDVAPEKSFLYQAVCRVYQAAGVSVPAMRIAVCSEIPVSSGLGSSASSIVAGLCGANALLGSRFSQNELAQMASALEGHPDNAVPTLVGGFTVAMSYENKVHFSACAVDANLRFLAVHPHYPLATRLAREILPKTVTMQEAIAQLQRGCYLAAAMQQGNYAALAAATDDVLFTPARRAIVRGYDAVKQSAMQTGALCTFISGAGPTILALARASDDCDAIAQAMGKALETTEKLESTIYNLQVDNEGARITEEADV